MSDNFVMSGTAMSGIAKLPEFLRSASGIGITSKAPEPSSQELDHLMFSDSKYSGLS